MLRQTPCLRRVIVWGQGGGGGVDYDNVLHSSLGVGVPSSSGGIPVENVVLEQISSGNEDHRAKLERDTMNRAAKAAFATNMDERNELIELRRKFMEMQRVLGKRAFLWRNWRRSRLRILWRLMWVLQILQEDIGVSGVKDSDGKEKHSKPASWSQVVRSAPILSNSVKFDYVHLPEGFKVVAPPIEVLKKGNNKLMNCIIGSISKGNVSFGRVSAFAHRVWDKRGLLFVFQKDNATFIFKFDLELSMNNVLASGTGYIGSIPMLVNAWGIDIHSESVKSIPMWVKLEKIPDCYWTQEGLSNLDSVIGRPLGADALTSRSEVLPFAKVCVEYIVGNDLPSKIEAMDQNPVTEEMTVVEVAVSYLNKPRFCSGCKTLSHIVGACPTTKRQWVQKTKVTTDEKKGEDEHPVNTETDKPGHDVSTPTHNSNNIANDEGEWHTVPHERAFSLASVAYSDNSPTPLNTFKNLTRVNEVDIKRAFNPTLSKLQQKKRKNDMGQPSKRSP
ncbi:hypothetical protein POM88_036898 [Heracleum sosnowskyi]|uniref:DUF4283 domain-containing protein n=1 Tax=Heracleum sosnowskyi TaxID=360622 RepID=A0AAD8HPD1_9APIA|nr:hypothetical protein POM88_036898 [Heracleum sosnowskyi]